MADDGQEIIAHTPDGATHHFPAGTDPAVVDGAVKQYITSQSPAAQPGAIQQKPGGPINNTRDPNNLPPPVPHTTGQKVAKGLSEGIAGGLGIPTPTPDQSLPGYMLSSAGEMVKNLIPILKDPLVGISHGVDNMATNLENAGREVYKGLGSPGLIPDRRSVSNINPEQVSHGLGTAVGLGAPIAATEVSKPLEDSLTPKPPTVAKAGENFERAVKPGGQSAIDQQTMRDTWQRAAKYIAPEARANPIEGGEGGVMRAADAVGNAKEKLWNNLQPAVDQFKQAQGDTHSVANDIRSSFTDLDKTTSPGKVSAGENLAKTFERPMTVGQMQDIVKQLNNDRSVSRYYNMSDMERTQAELADPSLRAKVTALDSLRGKMLDTLAERGGDKFGQQVAEARKDWGALKTIQQTLQDAKVPTPESLPNRALNTMRSIWRPETYGVRQTLFDMNNPNRLAPKALNQLGKTDLFAPDAPVANGPQVRGLLGTGAAQMPGSNLGETEWRSGAPTSGIVPPEPARGLPSPSQLQVGPSSLDIPEWRTGKPNARSGVRGALPAAGQSTTSLGSVVSEPSAKTSSMGPLRPIELDEGNRPGPIRTDENGAKYYVQKDAKTGRMTKVYVAEPTGK